MLTLIHKDHENIALLLELLKRKLEALRSERRVRYDLIRDVISYLHDYDDKHHHPSEDVIYNYYLEKQKQPGSEGVNYLAKEHKQIAEATSELQTLLEMILMDAVVPSDQFIQKLSEFIDMQKRHMDYEEDKILPLLEAQLTDDDWQEIYQRLPYPQLRAGGSPLAVMQDEDPLFGKEVAERYRELRRRISEVSKPL